MHAPPLLLVLDEPSDGVDPVGRKQIRDILHSLEAQGVTIFLNSHLLAEVELFCREVAIIQKGKVALSGTVEELTSGSGYKVGKVSQCRSSCKRNFAPGQNRWPRKTAR